MCVLCSASWRNSGSLLREQEQRAALLADIHGQKKHVVQWRPADCTTVILSAGKEWKTEEVWQQSGLGLLRTRFALATSGDTHWVFVVRGWAAGVAQCHSIMSCACGSTPLTVQSARAVVQAARAGRRVDPAHHRSERSHQCVMLPSCTIAIVVIAVVVQLSLCLFCSKQKV